MQKKSKNPTIAMKATPPTTPPTMGPVLELECFDEFEFKVPSGLPCVTELESLGSGGGRPCARLRAVATSNVGK
jgi:hypothetical protein